MEYNSLKVYRSRRRELRRPVLGTWENPWSARSSLLVACYKYKRVYTIPSSFWWSWAASADSSGSVMNSKR